MLKPLIFLNQEAMLKPMEETKPYAGAYADKKSQVALMFDNIARRYDFLNHFLSLGIDNLWRRKTIKTLRRHGSPSRILDVATGTGDLAIAALKLYPEYVTGVDIAENMLAYGRKKISRKDRENRINLQTGDAEALDFSDNTFDAITCAFGVRNFGNLQAGLREMFRVMTSGGQVAILEFSKPSVFPVNKLYNLYFRYILPFLGRLISKDRSAYTYLPNSVHAFPDGADFTRELEKAGFVKADYKPLTFGIATLYTAFKP